MEHLRKKFTSKEGRIFEKINGEEVVTYTVDLLEPYRKHLQSGMLHGFDFDETMLRIAAMNLMLHGVDTPEIHYQDILSNSFPEKFPRYAGDCYDLILANPPFKGSLDEQDVHPSLTGKVKTRKTELLFLTLVLRMLKLGGRCAVIVPDGVLFGSSNAHVAARKVLIEENQLEAVVKLPAGVFKPYAGVSTAILFSPKADARTTYGSMMCKPTGFLWTTSEIPLKRTTCQMCVLGGRSGTRRRTRIARTSRSSFPRPKSQRTLMTCRSAATRKSSTKK